MSKPKKPKAKSAAKPISRDARRLAAVILEVLAGQRTPGDAASCINVSLPRYYQLELRALEGLVAACEPRKRGGRLTPERQVVKLQAEIERLEKLNARQQSLLRLSQRAIGVSATTAGQKIKPAKGKRRRRPMARALKAATKLRAEASRLPAETNDEKK